MTTKELETKLEGIDFSRRSKVQASLFNRIMGARAEGIKMNETELEAVAAAGYTKGFAEPKKSHDGSRGY